MYIVYIVYIVYIEFLQINLKSARLFPVKQRKLLLIALPTKKLTTE